MKKYLCEFLGTCVLVLFGCGVAVATNANVIATSLAFGLSIVAVAYTIGGVSGCHVNPAVSFAMWIDKRMSTKDFALYAVAQVLGALAGAILLYLILSNVDYELATSTLGSNAYGDLTGSNITMLGALVTEIILTFVFVLTVLGVTKEKKYENVAPIVIGLSLVLVHLFGIYLTGTSVNPARSLAPAIVACIENGTQYLEQVWVFIVGPLVGAAFASLAIFFINLEETEEVKPAAKEEKKVVIPEVISGDEIEVDEEENTKKTTKKTTPKSPAKRGPKPNSTKKPKTTKTTKKN